jgi:hypothetical protein
MGGLKLGSNPPNIKQIMSINPIFTTSNKKSTEKNNNNGLRASVESHGATRITETLEHAFKENNHHNSFHLP